MLIFKFIYEFHNTSRPNSRFHQGVTGTALVYADKVNPMPAIKELKSGVMTKIIRGSEEDQLGMNEVGNNLVFQKKIGILMGCIFAII